MMHPPRQKTRPSAPSAELFGRNSINPLCAQCREQLFDFLDSSLDTAALAVLQAHLHDCAPCREELQQHQRAAAALTSAVQSVPPAGNLLDGFHARLAASESQRRMRRWRLTTPTFVQDLLATSRRQLYTPFGKIKLAAPALALGLLAVALVMLRHRLEDPMTTGGGSITGGGYMLSMSPLGDRLNLAPLAAAKTSPETKSSPTIKQTHRPLANISASRSRKRRPMLANLPSSSGRYRRQTGRIASLVSQTPPVGYDAPAPAMEIEAITSKDSVNLNGIQIAPDASKDLDATVPSLPARDREQASIQDSSEALRGLAAKAPPASGDTQGFTMVVQDDARGFTFESHCAETEIDDSGDHVIHIDIRGDDMPPSTR